MARGLLKFCFVGRASLDSLLDALHKEGEHILQTLREPDGFIGGLDCAAAQLEVKRTTLLMRAVNRNLPGYCRVLENDRLPRVFI
jgi:hypothetical protein